MRFAIRSATLAVLFLLASAAQAQIPAKFEYASVTGTNRTVSSTGQGAYPQGWISRATICYPTARGCRTESVDIVVDSPYRGAEAIMVAAMRLGEEGWELVTSTDLGARDDAPSTRVLYFRRVTATRSN